MTKENRKPERFAGMSFGDTHHGMINGLIMPGTEIKYGVGDDAKKRVFDDDNLTDWSKWLWYDIWQPACEFADQWAGGDPMIVTDGGDAVHGARHCNTEALYSPHIDHQVQIAKMARTPLRKLKTLAAYAMVFGTEAHDYGANGATLQLAHALAAWGWHDIKCDHHVRMRVGENFYLNLSHHGPSVSPAPHLRNNGLRNYFENVVLRTELEHGRPIDDLYVRAHVHNPAYTPISITWQEKPYHSYAMITPPMCGPNQFGRKAAKSPEQIKCGPVFWEVVDGKFNINTAFVKTKDARMFCIVPSNGTIFWNNMIADGGHKKKKKAKVK